MKRKLGAIAVLTISVAFGCGEYPHTNPYDPLVPVTLTIIGPDIVARLGATIRYQYKAEPEIPDGHATWGSSTPSLVPLGEGVFRVGPPGSTIITMQIGPHSKSKRVIVDP